MSHRWPAPGSRGSATKTSCAQRTRRRPTEPSVEEVHNHHNFAWREEHGGEDYWVVREGCTPAFPGQRGTRSGKTFPARDPPMAWDAKEVAIAEVRTAPGAEALLTTAGAPSRAGMCPTLPAARGARHRAA